MEFQINHFISMIWRGYYTHTHPYTYTHIHIYTYTRIHIYKYMRIHIMCRHDDGSTLHLHSFLFCRIGDGGSDESFHLYDMGGLLYMTAIVITLGFFINFWERWTHDKAALPCFQVCVCVCMCVCHLACVCVCVYVCSLLSLSRACARARARFFSFSLFLSPSLSLSLSLFLCLSLSLSELLGTVGSCQGDALVCVCVCVCACV